VSDSRVVTMSSPGHRILSAIDFDHLKFDSSYSRYAGYGQSKLANLLFTYELARRLEVKGAPTIALAAHPGASATELLRNVPGLIRKPISFVWARYAQSAAMGALPPLRAATDPQAASGQYYGPDGRGEQRGHPKVVDSSAQSHDEDLQRRLWNASEDLTGVTFPI
jgi:NAD(P)-dependent dehydrogenase (short-subunit alcohol dehydrogenase family)